MVRLARELWPSLAARRAAARPRTRPRSSAASSTRSPASIRRPSDLLDFCREEIARIEAFCRERDLIGLADEPLEIRWTPVFLRAFGGAMLISPGPLDKGLTAFFAITPIPDDWTPEQRESYLREDNDRMLRLPDDPRGRARATTSRASTPTARPSLRPDRSSGAGCSPRAGRST